MSYDKYIKYKNKYLQLKAKYTQVGGAKRWVITNVHQHGITATTQITIEESDALNKVKSFNKGRAVSIPLNNLVDATGNRYNYIYTIDANGETGKRTSLKGT